MLEVHCFKHFQHYCYETKLTSKISKQNLLNLLHYQNTDDFQIPKGQKSKTKN